LDFLCPGELREDGGAFDGVRTLNSEACLPSGWRRIVGRAIGGAVVDNCDFVGLGWRERWGVDELAFWSVGDGGVGEDLGER
jgi:hypothetical protein